MNEPLDPVDELLLEYLRATEAGEQPDLEALTSKLETDEQKKALRELCATTQMARRTFPELFRAQAIIGGRYRLLEQIGSGGYGKVWRAFDEKLERTVALKLFHALRDDREIAEDLQREKRALTGLRHEGLVGLQDCGKHEDAWFLVLEFIDGRSLEKALAALAHKDAPYPPPRVLVEREFGKADGDNPSLVEDTWFRTCARVLRETLWALSVAHAHKPHKVVHRDLKPGNVLLRAGGRPVLVDFGLAGIGDGAGDVTAQLFGTIAYMAPEQIKSEKTGKDESTDIYQAGLLLYEMLTMQRAFPGSDKTRTLEAVRQGEFAPPRRVRSEIPTELEDVCMRALERDPRRRYASAEQFRDDLERWLDGAVPAASKMGTAGRFVRSTRQALWRNRTAAALLLAVVTGALAVQTIGEGYPRIELAADRMSATITTERECTVTCVLTADAQGSGSTATFLPMSDGQAQEWVRKVPAGRSTVSFPREVEMVNVRGGAAAPRLRVIARPVEEAPQYRQFLARVAQIQEERGAGLTQAELEALRDELAQPTRSGDKPIQVDLAGIFD